MARIRTIKPEFWQDEDLAGVSAEANLLAIGLLNQADDEGYFKANPKLIQAAVFPLRDLSVNIHGIISELSNIGYITLKTGSDGKQYGHVTNFEKHQKINRPSGSKIRALMEFTECSVSVHDKNCLEQGTGNREQGVGKRFKKPTINELATYLSNKNIPAPEQLATKFYNHYESNGWKVGKNKMQSWPHALARWTDDHSAKHQAAPAKTPKVSEMDL